MGLPNNNIEAAIQQYGAAAVLREILKERPELEDRIVELVARVGIDAAVREIFGVQVQPAMDQPAPAQAETVPPAQGAQPEVPPASPVDFKIPPQTDIPSQMSGMQSRQGPAVGLTVGGAEPQEISPGIQQEVTEAMMGPGEIDIPVSRAAPTPATAMPETVPEAPAEAQATPMPTIPSMDMVIPAMSEMTGIRQNFKTFVNETANAGNFSKQCAKYRVPVQVMLALIKQESTFNPNKIGDAGEVGLTQLMLGTARDRGLTITTNTDERFDPKKNIVAGLKHLNWLKSYKPKSVDAWVAAYNAGHTKLIGDKWELIPSVRLYTDRIRKTVKSYQDNPQVFADDMSRLMKAVGGSTS